MTRLPAIVTDTVEGQESVEALTAREAGERLEASLEELRRSGIAASGAVGDPDPVLAAKDALLEEPADEVVIFERAPEQARWFEDGLFERAREEIAPPLRMVLVGPGDNGAPHIVAVEDAGTGGTAPEAARSELEVSENLPRVPPGDLGGMVVGVVGTIAAIVLAAAGPGPETAAGAASILIAMGIALINMAHVVGLTLFESVDYRGGWETFLRSLAMVGTPLAVGANLAILLLS